MKFLATGNEMQEIDRNSIDQIGIPGNRINGASGYGCSRRN